MESQDGLTVDQLSHAAGVSVRNIRYYQELGLIQAPERRGRQAFYDERQLGRLRRVCALREEGLSLEAIARLMEPSEGDRLRFMQTLLDDGADEQPSRVPLAQLLGDWPGVRGRVAERALRSSFFKELPEGEVEVRSPALLRIGGELAELEIPIEDAVELLGRLDVNLGEIAESYIELFLARVWGPAVERGEEIPWAELEQTLVRLRRLAGESVGAAFAVLMRERTERARTRQLATAAETRSPA
jgi:DNA-binding transcriptional MerR regulator